MNKQLKTKNRPASSLILYLEPKSDQMDSFFKEQIPSFFREAGYEFMSINNVSGQSVSEIQNYIKILGNRYRDYGFFLLGIHEGAAIGYHLLADMDCFTAAVLMDGRFNPLGSMYLDPSVDTTAPEVLWQSSPMAKSDRIHTPLLLASNPKDHRYGIMDSQQAFQCLSVSGLDVRLLLFDEDTEEFLRQENQTCFLKEALAWFGAIT